jgi:hypothetical protein
MLEGRSGMLRWGVDHLNPPSLLIQRHGTASIHIELHGMQNLEENKGFRFAIPCRLFEVPTFCGSAQSKQSSQGREPLEKRDLKQRHEALTKMVGPAIVP